MIQYMIWVQRVLTFFRTKLRGKIFALYVGIVVIPIIFLGLVAGYVIVSSFRSDYSNSVIEAVNQVADNVEYRKQVYELLVTRTATDGELIARISDEYTDFPAQLDTVRYIDRAFGIISSTLPGIAVFRIYHNNQTLVEDGGILWKPGKRMLIDRYESDWYHSVELLELPLKWDVVYDKVLGVYDLTLSRQIKLSYNETLGVVFLRVRNNEVFGQTIQNAFHGKGEIYLVQDNNFIFASSDNRYNHMSLATTDLKNIPLADSIQTKRMEIDNIQNIVVSKPISSGWHIIGTMPLEKLEKETRSVFSWVAIITVSLILLSTLLILAVMNNLVHRIQGLEQKTKAVTRGEFNESVLKKNTDELGDLEEGFNNMVGRLSELLEEIALSRVREREEAIKALQAQINPHFLYNTFSIIRWRALDAGDQKLCQLLDSMTTFYRLALNKGNSILRIREELDHVRAYIEIQQHRYMNSVNVIWDIDPNLNELYTIKLILQPIVENCYIHGMVAKRGHGELRISSGFQGHSVYFEISDNGIGMSEETLQNILLGNNISRGYGINNIKERLKLYFGDSGKVTIKSEWGVGTSVTIIIPICHEPPELKGGENNAESFDR